MCIKLSHCLPTLYNITCQIYFNKADQKKKSYLGGGGSYQGDKIRLIRAGAWIFVFENCSHDSYVLYIHFFFFSFSSVEEGN